MNILNRRSIGIALAALAMSVFLAFGGATSTQAQTAGPALFADVAAAPPAADGSDSSAVARSRFVQVDVGLLFDANGNQRDKQSLPEITLNLFPDATFTGEVIRTEKDAMSTNWYGKLKGKKGYFYLVVADGAFIAHVASPEGVYEVSYADKDKYKAVQIDQSKFIDHDPEATFDPPGDVLTQGDLGPAADSAATIDIMVVYTDDAKTAEGGTAPMKARIALAVYETNVSYANDNVTTRLRLVHVEEYAYVETGSLNTDLTRLRNTTDAYFTTVHSLRNTYGADMVGLIVENGGAYCGLASAIMATEANAFQVTDRGCATGYYSFGHEFGHLQGARHDTYVDNSITPYAYGHGYAHRGSTTAQRWRTIMAYNDYCSVVGYNCTRLQWWSNPTKVWQGAPMGVVNVSENYRVLNNTAFTVANFRQAVIGANFYSSFTSSSSGWTPVTGTWTLSSSNYYRSTGVANSGASAVHTSKYGDLTYVVRMYRNGTQNTRPNRIIIRGNPASLDPTNWWKPSYVFQYTNDGRFSVYEETSAGSQVALKAWTLSAAIVKNGWNTLKVVAVGPSLKFYINNALVWVGSDYTLKTGQVGVGFYREAVANTLLVDYAQLYTTPTADLNPDEVVLPGVETPGGSIDKAP